MAKVILNSELRKLSMIRGEITGAPTHESAVREAYRIVWTARARASIRDDISTVGAAVPAVQVQRPGSKNCIRTFIATTAPM